MPNILDLQVLDFSPLYSDAHCPVALTLNIETVDDQICSENVADIIKPRLWNAEKSENFINNIDILKVAEIEMHLDQIKDKNNVSQEEVDTIVLEICALFESTAKETFGYVNIKKNKNKNKNIKSIF